jgi:cyclohexanecarboxylate-CoA ligase
MEVRIVAPDDPDGERGELAPGEVGLLQARGASQTTGYFQRPDIYEAALHPAGDGGADWFDTGDLARRRPEDGGIRIAGRAKDLVIRGGENVPVVEVEAVLYTHPRVRECAIVGIPDERLGERACAVVVAGGAGEGDGDVEGDALTLEELVAHCEAAGMARQFWPERLELVDEMPKTPSGKIQKFLLRERLVEGL